MGQPDDAVMEETSNMEQLTQTAQWQALADHRGKFGATHLRELFAADPQRAAKHTLTVGDLTVDYSKNLVTAETLELLVALARARRVEALRDAMFRGEKINVTEDRAVLHVALRAPRSERIEVDGHDVVPDVHEVLDRMAAFSDRIRSRSWLGHTGERGPDTTTNWVGVGAARRR